MTHRTIAMLIAIEILWFASLAFALADRRVHQRDPAYGVNQWGYRGEARAEREPGEIRVALVGGSAAYEGGLPIEDTLASSLFFELRDAGAPLGQAYSVVNLAEPRIGADSYSGTIRRYEFLDPDVVIIFDGYDAVSGWPPHARERSVVFRASGYLPILPRLLLGRPAWLSDPDGSIAGILQDGTPGSADLSCTGVSSAYCAAITDAVRSVIQRRRAIIVVAPPSVSSRHALQQRSLGETLNQAFGREPRFMYLDLSSAVDLSNAVNSPDGVRRTVVGNHEIGQRLAQVMLKWTAGMRRPDRPEARRR